MNWAALARWLTTPNHITWDHTSVPWRLGADKDELDQAAQRKLNTPKES